MTNDNNDHLQFPVLFIIYSLNQTLLAPVLQHLDNAVARHSGAFHSHRVLHCLIFGKLWIQSLKDRIILTRLQTLPTHASRIVTTTESILDTVAEEIEGILYQRLGYHIIDLQHLWCLGLQQLFLPEVGLLLQLTLCTI